MIKATLKFGQDMIEAVISEQGLMFLDISTGQITSLEGLKFDKAGVVKEFPDLENDDDWKKEAIRRFKNHLKKFKTEEEQLNYIIKELEKHGYTKLFTQKAGFRPKK